MTTSQALRLVRGDKYIDLSSSPYAINEFTPPPMALTPTVATGSSANRTGGGKLVATSYNDRSLSFSVRVLGTTATQIRNAINAIVNLLAGYNEDQSVKMYIEYAPISDTPEPLWGTYGARLHYEIVYGTASVWDNYSNGPLRAEGALVYVSCEIKPFAETNQLQLCTATGGINEDRLGSLKGVSRGLLVPEATTNKHTNPVFGNSTYDTNWTTGASLIKSQITTNPLLGYSSVQLTAAAAANNTFYEAITLTATTYTLSYYVTLPDLSTPSSTQLQVVYDGAAQSSTYYQIEGGLYLVWASVTGTAAAHNCGIVVKNGYTVILHAAQCEAKAYPTPLAYGDMMGCAWSSTAHASASTRTAASCKLPITDAVIKAGEGSVRMIVRFDVANTHANYMFLCDLRDGTHTSAPVVFFNPSDDRLYLQTNTSTYTNSGALTFSAGTTYVIHATWGAGTATLYVNGAQVDSDAYTTNALGTYMFIGSDYSSVSQLVGAISMPATYNRALTSAEVLADYTEIAAILARNDVLEGFPVFWTKSGDNVLSLDTGKQPLGVSFGIAGNAPAVSEFYCSMSNQWQDVYSVVFSNLASEVTVPISNLLSDISGTAAAGDYGGQHETTSLTAGTALVTPVGVLNHIVIDNNFVRYFGDVDIQTYVRAKYSTAGTGSIYTRYYNGVYIHSDANTATFGTVYRGYLSKSLSISLPSDTSNTTYYSRFFVGATMGTAGTLSADYFALLPRPIAVITDGGSISAYGFLFKGHTSYSLESSANKIYTYLDYRGDEIEFVPNAYNHLQMYFCPTGTINPVTTFAGTMTGIYVTPRWSLL